MAMPLCPDDELGTKWTYPDTEPFRVVEEYFTSSRDTQLYGKHLLQWKSPTTMEVSAGKGSADQRGASKGSVLCLFGAGDHCNSPYHGGQMITLARMGFDVHSFDYESLGRSSPTHAQELQDGEPRFFIQDFNNLADDAVTFAVQQIGRHAHPAAQLFIFGESMGGAVGLLASRKLETSGAVILAPMCKLGKGMKPGPVMTAVLTGLAHITPRTYAPLGKVEPPKVAKQVKPEMHRVGPEFASCPSSLTTLTGNPY
jgi:alpha-beta hydrolase superfamily lysophospholipase